MSAQLNHGTGATMSPTILFVPVSGPGGAGEYFRSVAIARGVLKRWPQAQIHFLLNRHASYAAESDFPVVLLDDSPTRDVRAVIGSIEHLRPHLVIFDSAGRVSQLRAAHRVGARVVYVSSRFKTRWKGFRLRRMYWLDEHWIAQPEFLNGRLSRYERLKLRLMAQVKVLFLPALFEPADEELAETVTKRFGLQRDRFVLCCPGGSGDFGDGVDAPTVFLEAARRIASESGLKTIVVGTSTMPAAESGVITTPVLRNAELMALVGAARVCVVNGGSLLLQALSQQAVCVAAPIAGDQPARIAGCLRLGLVQSAPLAADALAFKAIALLRDDAMRATLRQRVRALDLRNGVELAVASIERLLTRT